MQEAEDREELESFSAAVHALRSRLQVSTCIYTKKPGINQTGRKY